MIILCCFIFCHFFPQESGSVAQWGVGGHQAIRCFYVSGGECRSPKSQKLILLSFTCWRYAADAELKGYRTT